MKNLAILILLINVTFLLQGQDINYTLNCEKNGANTNLDSILFENLSNDSHIIFGALPDQRSYVVNLSSQKIEINTGLMNFIDEDQLYKVVKNIPGEISIQCKNKISDDIILSIINLNGKKLFSQKISTKAIANTININIPYAGMYILNLNSTAGVASYKVAGSESSGTFSYAISENNIPETAFTKLKSVSVKNESDFSFQKGDSLRVTAYLNGNSTYPVVFKVNESDTLNLFFVSEDENYLIVENIKYPLNLGHHVWFSELDCGNFDIYAHGLYLTSDITINKFGNDQTGKSLFPKGKGNMLVFNMFNKDSTFVPGKYIFVDEINCSGEVTDGANTYTMGESDKLVTAKTEMNDPTFYALNVDLEIDWVNVDFDNPSSDVITKFTNYKNASVGIKKGNVLVEKNNETYTITFDCLDNNGLIIRGKYKGSLNFIEFGI
jgi:hypothetical protein